MDQQRPQLTVGRHFGQGDGKKHAGRKPDLAAMWAIKVRAAVPEGVALGTGRQLQEVEHHAGRFHDAKAQFADGCGLNEQHTTCAHPWAHSKIGPMIFALVMGFERPEDV